MKNHDGNSSSKTKLLILITCSAISVFIVLQYLESHYILFSLQIFKRNKTMRDEWQYQTPLKPLNVPQKQLNKVLRSKYKTRRSAQQTE